MNGNSTHADIDEELQFTCFYVGETLCGFDIALVREVNNDLNITQVPLSPDFVVGIMNLRGQIITVIDQGRKLGLPPSKIQKSSRVIIIKSQTEYIGLLVDKIAEVITCSKRQIAKPPSNVKGLQGKFFEGVVHTDSNELLALLDIERVLDEEPNQPA
ncbi:MAG: purine-binding chemotaxis protein CheW [Proteobacteria bacterium]|nr:purine-binding chemotaxis protein CheW [Pseudomonadota bacterium]